jgi:hypothetical protein
VRSVRVGTAPRSSWGRKLSPRNVTISRTSPWVYVGVPAVNTHDRVSIVARQRAVWQALLLVESLHSAACRSGRRVELGDSIQPPHGTETVAGDFASGVPTFRAGPFMGVRASFRARVRQLGSRYGFRLRSLVVLHSVGDAPQIRIESDHPSVVMRNIDAIGAALWDGRPYCSKTRTCFDGTWLEGDDSSGQPFVAFGSVETNPTGAGSEGSTWVRRGLPYPSWVR